VKVENAQTIHYLLTKIGPGGHDVKHRDLWVMFYFGAFWKPKAFDTFACSYDLVHWAPWKGPHLVEPSEPWDREYAHKPWVLKYNGVVYHYYCAVGDRGRVIALADLEGPERQASGTGEVRNPNSPADESSSRRESRWIAFSESFPRIRGSTRDRK
jgi:hypothetical protein